MQALAQFKPKAEITLRVYRKATGKWEDGPKVNAAAGVGFFKSAKMALLLRSLHFLERILKKLESLK